MGEILKSNFWELLQLVNTAEKGKKGKDPGWEDGKIDEGLTAHGISPPRFFLNKCFLGRLGDSIGSIFWNIGRLKKGLLS